MSPAGISTASPTGDAAASQRRFELRCADVHSCRCGMVFSGPDPSELVALAQDGPRRMTLRAGNQRDITGFTD